MNYLKALLFILVFFFHFTGITTHDISQSSAGLIETKVKIESSTGRENNPNPTTLKIVDIQQTKATLSPSQNSKRKIPVSTYTFSIGTGSAALF
jgi:hypothetical protein